MPYLFNCQFILRALRELRGSNFYNKIKEGTRHELKRELTTNPH